MDSCQASLEFTVGVDDTAIAMGSGDVPVLGTPRALAMMEAATLEAIRSHLDPGQTTVGVAVSLNHGVPSVAGSTVIAHAATGIPLGRRIVFDVSLTSQGVAVAEGRIERVTVDRDRFLRQLPGPSQ
jgi:predicted thioesterase